MPGIEEREREREKKQERRASSKDTDRLETVVTTPSPASYCIDPVSTRSTSEPSPLFDFETSFVLSRFEESHDPS